MQGRRSRSYLAAIEDADGVTHQYVFEATSRRRAERDAREWVARSYWGASLVGVSTPQHPVNGRRLVAVAGVTLVTCGPSIAVMTIVALRMEGAL